MVTKIDLAAPPVAPVSKRWLDLAAQLPFADSVAVSAVRHEGLDDLRAAIARRLADRPTPAAITPHDELRVARSALKRAQALAAGRQPLADGAESRGGSKSPEHLESPELISVELRLAEESLRQFEARAPLDERLLDRIFTQFCVGK